MLKDKFGRVVDYLRISVTDRCNLRCTYCMSEEGIAAVPHGEILRYEEILKIVDTASELGIKKFRITGGEPLVRKGIVELLSELSARNIDFSLTTNGILLADFAVDMQRAGVKRINISLDTLSEKKFFEITRGGDIKKVISGILKAKDAGIDPVKINAVVLAETSAQDIENLIEFAGKNGVILRFIEHLPFADKAAGRFFDIESSFRKKYNLVPAAVEGFGPGRHYKIGGFKNGCAVIGFISAISKPFCRNCNRLRLTADGKLLSCLSSPNCVDLKKILRCGGEMKESFFEAVKNKPEKHVFENPRDCMSVKNMSGIGG